MDIVSELLTKYGQYVDGDFAKCVIFPIGKTTWKGFHRPFEDGDIVTCTNENCTYTAIYKEMKDNNSFYRHAVTYDNEFCCVSNDWSDFNETCRFATEEEKEKLFDAIKANGYKWNEETKALEKLPKFKVGDIIQYVDTYKVKITEVNIEDECYGFESMIAKGIGSIPFSEQNNWKLISNKFDITTLVPFESRVLMRSSNAREWVGTFYSHYNNNKFYGCGMCCDQCIPYEGNEHLIGKTDECNDFYKTW